MIYLILLLVVLAAVAVCYMLARRVISAIFGSRSEGTRGARYFQAADFEGLDAVPVSFRSMQNEQLRGFFYTSRLWESSPRGILIWVHGMGGGHTAYTTEINTFAKAGYQVLGYDNTGTMLSDGPSLRGFPQAIQDLASAYDYVQENNPSRLPVYLAGHSWGAYAVCAFLQLGRPVAGVIALSPLENPVAAMAALASQNTGKKLGFLKPFLFACTLMDFGQFALYRPSYGLQRTQVPVLLMHGTQDTMIPESLSPLAFRSFFEKNPAVQILLVPGKAHNVYITAAAQQAMADYFTAYTQLNAQYNGNPPAAAEERFIDSADFRKMTEEDLDIIHIILDFLDKIPVSE
ncbi:MAG: alpha/beta fold hydrolase [Firmicutes bacterium]|nr:alpha/beta fold hydrolase [Bacillota bacterium]